MHVHKVSFTITQKSQTYYLVELSYTSQALLYFPLFFNNSLWTSMSPRLIIPLPTPSPASSLAPDHKFISIVFHGEMIPHCMSVKCPKSAKNNSTTKGLGVSNLFPVYYGHSLGHRISHIPSLSFNFFFHKVRATELSP